MQRHHQLSTATVIGNSTLLSAVERGTIMTAAAACGWVLSYRPLPTPLLRGVTCCPGRAPVNPEASPGLQVARTAVSDKRRLLKPRRPSQHRPGLHHTAVAAITWSGALAGIHVNPHPSARAIV